LQLSFGLRNQAIAIEIVQNLSMARRERGKRLIGVIRINRPSPGSPSIKNRLKRHKPTSRIVSEFLVHVVSESTAMNSTRFCDDTERFGREDNASLGRDGETGTPSFTSRKQGPAKWVVLDETTSISAIVRSPLR
jgi:hypothetical protein